VELVDSHCHLNFPELHSELDVVIGNAHKRNVAYILCAAVNLEDYSQIQSLTANYPHIYHSVGVHPNETTGIDPTTEELVVLAEDPAVVAIGETGLDYFRIDGRTEWQQQRFRRHIAASRLTAKPLIIHTRDAVEDTVRIMREENAGFSGGVIHCFTGNWAMAKLCLDQGFYISFSGILTFKNAHQIQEAASKVPLDRILVETDSPYLAPVPYRGKRNQPSYVYEVAAFLAHLRGITLETVAKVTTENFFRLFTGAKPLIASKLD